MDAGDEIISFDGVRYFVASAPIMGTGPLSDLAEACTPMGELSSMQARVVFDLLHQRGWRIVRVNTDE